MTSIATGISPQAAVTPAVPTGGSAAAGADLNMFLKLLTTQMQNQDPLDPMDTSQYTQQLAQYSQVEQSIEQNKSLKDILGRLSTQDMASASAFIGREARFDVPQSALSQSFPASWSFTAGRAASLVATVTDAAGREMVRTALDPAAGGGRFSWDGTLPDGSRAPAGVYTLSVTAVDPSGAQVETNVEGLGVVQQVLLEGDRVSLGANGMIVPLEALVSVGAAS
jgi:flagellar basal-body rod modification protein FlgD